jgi:hypothetical protein
VRSVVDEFREQPSGHCAVLDGVGGCGFGKQAAFDKSVNQSDGGKSVLADDLLEIVVHRSHPSSLCEILLLTGFW